MHSILNSRPLLIILLLFIAGNLVILDIYLFNSSEKSTRSLSVAELTQKKSTQTPTTAQATNISCSNACIDQIKQATLSSATTPVGGPIKQSSTNVVVNSSIKEFFVPIGGGSSNADVWTDVSGLQVSVDSNAYGSIKKVTFEASLYTPTGNQTAYARLYNVTDKHPVWFSEVSIEGGTSQLKVSGGITLDPGVKLYQVQMKTQLKSTTNLEQARIRITTF